MGNQILIVADNITVQGGKPQSEYTVEEILEEKPIKEDKPKYIKSVSLNAYITELKIILDKCEVSFETLKKDKSSTVIKDITIAMTEAFEVSNEIVGILETKQTYDQSHIVYKYKCLTALMSRCIDSINMGIDFMSHDTSLNITNIGLSMALVKRFDTFIENIKPLLDELIYCELLERGQDIIFKM